MMMDAAYGTSNGAIDLHDDLGSSDGNHSSGSGRPGSLPLSCKECRASKVKCERVFPCARCSRLGLSCSPQVRKKRRQPTKPAAAPVPTFQINTVEGVRYMKHTPISSLVKAFFECKEAGTLNKPRTLCFFRSWARVRELYGLKSLEVVLDMMLKALGVDDWRDLIHDEGLTREMLMYTGEDGTSPEETTPGMPKPTGAHVIDSLPFFIKELFYSTNCASKMTVCEEVIPVSYANDLFDRLFNPDPTASSESLFFLPPKPGGQDIGMSLSECMIRAIHPTDGAELFSLFGNMFFSGQSNPCGVSHIVRCRTSRGESFMAMVRGRFYVRNGGRFWCNNVAFQPLPMSRFLFPLAKPLGPAESTAGQDSTFASLCVFEEPAQPQGCKTCEVMTKEALSFHFRALSEAPKPEGTESADDVFVSQGSFERMKLEEAGSFSGEEPAKKARHMPPYQQSRDVQVLPTPSYIQLPPKEPFMPPPPPVAQMPPQTNPHHPPVMSSFMPPPQPMSQPAAANAVLMNATQAAAPEFDTLPMAPPLGQAGSNDSMPSFNLSPSDVEVLDALLATNEEEGEEDEEGEEESMPSPSWENWEQSQQVGDDFWQHIGVMAPLGADPLDAGVMAQTWGTVKE